MTRQTSRRSSSISTQAPGRGREDDVVAGLHRHLDAGLGPPVEAGADGEDDPLLGRRLMGTWRDDQAGAADSVLVQLLDHDLVEQRSQLVAYRLGGVGYLRGAHRLSVPDRPRIARVKPRPSVHLQV